MEIGTAIIQYLFSWLIFYHKWYIASYEDDNTPYIITHNIDDLIKSLKKASVVLSNGLMK